jgi:hypothetical protein
MPSHLLLKDSQGQVLRGPKITRSGKPWNRGRQARARGQAGGHDWPHAWGQS